MQRNIQERIVKIGAATGLGVGFILLKLLKSHKQIIPELEYTTYLKHSPLGVTFKHFRDLEQPAELLELIKHGEKFLQIVNEYKEAKKNGMEFIANRSACSLQTHAEKMIEDAKRSRVDGVLNAAVVCEVDELKTMQKICDTMLHNMLL